MKLRVVALLAMLSPASCATATEDFDGVAPGRRVDGGRDTGALDEEDDTGTTTDDSGSTPEETSSTGDSEALPGDSTPATDSGSPMDTGAPPGGACTTLTAADCTGATSIGNVSGDTGSGVKTATGTDSKFVRVTVAEDDSAVFSSKDPRARIRLKSVGGNFNLYVYQGPSKGDGGGVECTTFKVSATEPAADDVVNISWNDNRPVGGHDDTRVLTIEVRATMPSCVGASWTLTVEGNK